jgi:hypothetical protein
MEYALDEDAVVAFAEKVGADQAIVLGAALAYVGDRLGLWAALAAAGPATSAELAAQTGLTERYLREWLAAQAAAGYLDHDAGRFTLSPERAAVLAIEGSPAAMAGGFELATAIWAGTGQLAEAFRTGRGISWAEQDPRLAGAVDRCFRANYAASLVDEWLPALDGVVAKLEAGARVLDVGCGHGTAAVMIAEAFPQAAAGGEIADRRVLSRSRASSSSRYRHGACPIAAAATLHQAARRHRTMPSPRAALQSRAGSDGRDDGLVRRRSRPLRCDACRVLAVCARPSVASS